MDVSLNSTLHEKPIWVVVADASKAIVYTRDTRRGPLKERDVFENSMAREKTTEFLSDSGGRSFDSHGHGRHTLTREKSGPKQQSTKAFAKEVSQHIVDAITGGTCRDFALVSAPRFLGYLREALSAAPNVVPYVTIDKDMVGTDKETIERLLQESLD
jgi:protein required for attachment to host cells